MLRNCPCDRGQFMQDLEVQSRSVQGLFILVYFMRKGFRSASNLAHATTLGSSLSHHVFLYAVDPLGRWAALVPGAPLALPNSAQFGGIYVAIIDHNLILGSSPLARCI